MMYDINALCNRSHFQIQLKKRYTMMYNTNYVIDHIFKLSLKTLNSGPFSFHSGNSENQFLPEIPGMIPPEFEIFSKFQHFGRGIPGTARCLWRWRFRGSW